jgi:formate hydrogenlyase subunit 3/multisubunit Na+/H+ antiporter MnhD subunit/NADH:ubiquinone oxidoreductase subunit 3 (subunit A)
MEIVKTNVTANDIFSSAFIDEILKNGIEPDRVLLFLDLKYGKGGFATESFPDKYDQIIIRYYLDLFLPVDNNELFLMISPQQTLGLFIISSLILVLIFILLAFLFNYSKVNYYIASIYECGFKPIQPQIGSFDVQFFQIGILFLLFDVEILVFFPWALTFYNLQGIAQFGIFFFFSLLCVGFYYEIQTQTLNFYPHAWMFKQKIKPMYQKNIQNFSAILVIFMTLVFNNEEIIRGGLLLLFMMAIIAFLKGKKNLTIEWIKINYKLLFSVVLLTSLYHLTPPECPIYAPHLCVYLNLSAQTVIYQKLILKAFVCVYRYFYTHELFFFITIFGLFLYSAVKKINFIKFLKYNLMVYVLYVLSNYFVITHDWVISGLHNIFPFFTIDSFFYRIRFLISLLYLLVLVLIFYLIKDSKNYEIGFIIIIMGIISAFMVGVDDLFSLFIFAESLTILVIILLTLTTLWKTPHKIKSIVFFYVFSLVSAALLLMAISLSLYVDFKKNQYGHSFFEAYEFFFKINAAGLTGNITFQIMLVWKMIFCLILLFFFSKLGIFQSFSWALTVYVEISYSMFAFILTVYKGIYLVLLAKLLSYVIILPIFSTWVPFLLQFVAIIAMCAGLGAFWQNSLKIILAFTTITQIGYVLVSLAAWTPLSTFAAFIYFFWYCLLIMLFVGLLAFFEKNYFEIRTIADLEKVYSISPFIWSLLVTVVISIAGLPFTGFIVIKLYLFVAVYKAGWIMSVLVILAVSLVQTYVYFIILKKLFTGFGLVNWRNDWFKEKKNIQQYSWLEFLLLIFLAVLSFLFATGIFWIPFIGNLF